jgi:hypothetical protein
VTWREHASVVKHSAVLLQLLVEDLGAIGEVCVGASHEDRSTRRRPGGRCGLAGAGIGTGTTARTTAQAVPADAVRAVLLGAPRSGHRFVVVL